MTIQMILVAAWAGIGFVDERSVWTGIHKPLIATTITGLILGDLKAGVMIGATLEVMWLGTANVGAYIPPNVTSGAIIGAAIAILSGKGQEVGVAIAIPVSVICQQISMLANTFNISIIHLADKLAETGNFKKVARLHLLGIPVFFLIGFVPVLIAIAIGGPAAESLIEFIPESVMNGLGVASGIIPAVGMGMLLMMMMKKNMWMFLVLGFVLASYMGLSTLPLAMVGLVFGCLYDMIITKNENQMIVNQETVQQSGEEYDL